MIDSSLKLSYRGKTLIAEWDNRRIRRSLFTTVFLAAFWMFWTPCTIFMTYCLLSGRGPMFFLCVWLLFGYAGVLLIPMTWVERHTVERIEIDNKRYRHYFVNLPWWFPKTWDSHEITQIDFGNYNDESMTTLNVRLGRKRDMIAYWATPGFRELLFNQIRAHLRAIGSNIPTIELNAQGDSDNWSK